MRYHTNLIWFDGDWFKGRTSADAKQAAQATAYIRQLDPSVIINKRLRHEPEPGETCKTSTIPWGYKRNDTAGNLPRR